MVRASSLFQNMAPGGRVPARNGGVWFQRCMVSMLALLRAQGPTAWCVLQAVFVVGVEAETDASVLDSYAVDVLRRMVAGWLSLGPDVRTFACATCDS